jgi:hypothetical protein
MQQPSIIIVNIKGRKFGQVLQTPTMETCGVSEDSLFLVI